MAKETYIKNINTGTTPVLIKDENGNELGTIVFNPSDLDIARRFDKVLQELEEMELKEDNEVEEFFKLSEKIKNSFDYLMNYKVSDVLFSRCNPFTPLPNGDFFCEHILTVIAEMIEEITDQRIKKKEAKIKKRTAKYTTQYHK